MACVCLRMAGVCLRMAQLLQVFSTMYLYVTPLKFYVLNAFEFIVKLFLLRFDTACVSAETRSKIKIFEKLPQRTDTF